MTTRKPIERVLHETPYTAEHEASKERQMSTGIAPKGLPSLVAWFVAAWALETPDKLHDPGVWRDYGEEAVGASALGAPRYSDAFRRYLENSDSETDPDGYYVRPMHATLSYMTRSRHPLLARRLFVLAQVGGDWRKMADRTGEPHEHAEILTRQGLIIAWNVYRDYPVSRRVA